MEIQGKRTIMARMRRKRNCAGGGPAAAPAIGMYWFRLPALHAFFSPDDTRRIHYFPKPIRPHRRNCALGLALHGIAAPASRMSGASHALNFKLSSGIAAKIGEIRRNPSYRSYLDFVSTPDL